MSYIPPKPPIPAFSAEIAYEMSKQELEDLIRAHSGHADAKIEWDINQRGGTLRGVTIKVRRTEIRG